MCRTTHRSSPIVPNNPKLAIEAGLAGTGLKLARNTSKNTKDNEYAPDITPGGYRDRPKLGLLCLSLGGNRFSQSGTRLSCGWARSGLAVVGMGSAVFGCVKV